MLNPKTKTIRSTLKYNYLRDLRIKNGWKNRISRNPYLINELIRRSQKRPKILLEA